MNGVSYKEIIVIISPLALSTALIQMQSDISLMFISSLALLALSRSWIECPTEIIDIISSLALLALPETSIQFNPEISLMPKALMECHTIEGNEILIE